MKSLFVIKYKAFRLTFCKHKAQFNAQNILFPFEGAARKIIQNNSLNLLFLPKIDIL